MGTECVLTDQERIQYAEAANKQMLEFDSRLLWFSGGGLIATLTFARAAGSSPGLDAVLALALGGCCLLTSSGITLHSFQRSAVDIANFLDNPTLEFRREQMREMRVLNSRSLVFLLVGLVLLGVFVVSSLLGS